MKCFYCNKKHVILLKCRCENQFCTKHILAEAHECNFDYVAYSKKLLTQNNPKIVALKVTPI
uniref:AN1-type domain-containing protein n=1 Tax=viral metagenome TaxID=1070528 RepID=A0A6C0JDZ8_9ZZZZ